MNDPIAAIIKAFEERGCTYMGNLDFCPHVIDCNDGLIVELFELDTIPDALRALATIDGVNYVAVTGHVIRDAKDVNKYLDSVFDHFAGLEDF